jgi:hypothetical protein
VETGDRQRSDRGQRAFDHAVARELAAIATHTRAAAMHDESAAVLEQAALSELDPDRLDTLITRAETERDRSAAARRRAATVRGRLRAEGVRLEQ